MSSSSSLLSHTNIPELRKWRFCAQVLWPPQGPAFQSVVSLLQTRLVQSLKSSPPEQTVRSLSKKAGPQPAPAPYAGLVWEVQAHQRRTCIMCDEDESFGADIEEMSFQLRRLDARCMVLFTAASTEQSFSAVGRRGYMGWHLPDDLAAPYAKGHQCAVWQHLGESSLHQSDATYEAFLSEGNARMPQTCIAQVQAACFSTASMKQVLPATVAWLRQQHLQAAWLTGEAHIELDPRSRL